MASPDFRGYDTLGRGEISVLNSFPVSIFIGIALGYLSGLGVGGGSLLIVWLTAIVSMDAPTARIINLMFFIASAVSVTVIRWFQGELRGNTIVPAVIAGCCGAGLAAYCGRFLDQALLKKLYGGLLIFIGLRELFYRPRNAK